MISEKLINGVLHYQIGFQLPWMPYVAKQKERDPSIADRENRAIAVKKDENYMKFHDHLEEYKKKGIPTDMKLLIKLAKKYDCEIPEFKDGKLIWQK